MALARRSLTVRLAETASQYWSLGLTSFGGPGVHVVILKKRFVEKLQWIDMTTYLDLFTLGNALPGPGSTQLAFSIALVRNGTLAALLAFLFWSLPGAVGMGALGVGVRRMPDELPEIVLALLSGLNAAAVGLIALAAYQLSLNCITDHLTRLVLMYPILIVTGGLLTLSFDNRHLALTPIKKAFHKRSERAKRNAQRSSAPSTTPGADAITPDIELTALPQHTNSNGLRPESPGNMSTKSGASTRQRHVGANASLATPTAEESTQSPTGAISGPLSPPGSPIIRPAADARVGQDQEEAETEAKFMVLSHKAAFGLFFFFLVFVVTILVVRANLDLVPRSFDFFTNMVIAGLIIFGGGPVVIPLLRSYVVQTGWISDRDFLIGFAILQAFPGPNFNFAVFCGVLAVNTNPALGAFLGWLGIFSPGIILKLALLPLYSKFRKHPSVRSTLRGLNAAASGLVFSATYQLFIVGYIYQSAAGSRDQKTMSGSLTSDPFWTVVVAGSFVASQFFSSPPWLSIAGGAVAGLAWYGVQKS
ncbi:unnamed protein product [Tilletia laevis]|uniref:Chromate transporter n=1 Tax=Tilletia laevis TaxID=157183 RepID=A0A9N8LAK4_9BASI|nr:unnamed protein product [Tilletia laevis]CAD6908490.1 unnamed protein product [Tilletia controversa]CAD6910037.1 unnamed protein product [Tilletia laevis]CAD6954443.1 unnamed protein product [Tilletia controversa]CAD6967284.1 unnamed protein product [Tilletia controversa]